jgi:hypothetical protein
MAAAYRKSLVAATAVVVTGGAVVVTAGVVVGVVVTGAAVVVVAAGVVVTLSPQEAAKADNTIMVNIIKRIRFIFPSGYWLISFMLQL